MARELYLVNPPNPCDMKGFSGALLSLDLWTRKHAPSVRTRIVDEEETSILNLENSLEQKLSDASETPFVGITATTASYQGALATARAIKKIRPGAKVILGGHHVNGQEYQILRHPEIDITVTGEGEKALESILRGDLNAPGITTRGELYIVSQRPQKGIPLTSQELNSLNCAEFNPEYHFRATQFKEASLVTARGCPLNCSFCAVRNPGDKSYRASSQDPEIVVNQFDYLMRGLKQRGLSQIIAVQDNFFAQNPTRAKDIASRLKEYQARTGQKLNWNVQTRVEQFEDSDLVRLMAEAGCTSAYFGIENFDERMLKTLGKAHNSSNYIRTSQKAIENCLRYGIEPSILFQAGIEGEDAESEKINCSALDKIGRIARRYSIVPTVYPSLSVVYQGTEFWDRMVKNGAPYDSIEEFCKWENSQEAKNYREAIHGYFAHGTGGIPPALIDIGKLRSREISLDMGRLEHVKGYIDRLKIIDGVRVYDYRNQTRK